MALSSSRRCGQYAAREKLDRSSSKWRIRASQSQRSIYQNQQGSVPTVSTDDDDADEVASTSRKGQTVVETYFASADGVNFPGVNFATLVPVGENADIVFAGQVAKSKDAPQRFETAVKFRPADAHQVRLDSSFSYLGKVEDKAVGQFSVQATDEWRVRDGVILVLGFDYSQFTGSGSGSSLSPRLGLQFDLNAKTRFAQRLPRKRKRRPGPTRSS